MKVSPVIVIEQCIKEGIETLKADLIAFWPWNQNSGMNEVNLALHVAPQFRKIDCQVFAEVTPIVQSGSPNHGRGDFLALNLSTWAWALVIESKVIGPSKQAVSLGTQWNRLLEMKFPNEAEPHLRQGVDCYVCLLVSCWDEAVKDWWLTQNNIRPPKPTGKKKDGNWSSLKSALESAQRIGMIDVTRPYQGDKLHWILYSIHHLGKDRWA
jgi:hypothetical protein